MIIKGLNFVQTCGACPEQYDVYDNDHNIVGYVRLRWGGLSCEYPDVGGEEIYSANIGDGWTGSFDNQEDRDYHLNAIANRILGKIKQSDKVGV